MFHESLTFVSIFSRKRPGWAMSLALSYECSMRVNQAIDWSTLNSAIAYLSLWLGFPFDLAWNLASYVAS